ncbi:MAG: cytochrome c oxidase assembly protein [Alphaproteobacteria bacterium]
MKLRLRNRVVALGGVAVVAGMLGLSYAAVPLYQLFCQVTGYGGTPQQADVAPDQVLDRTITVRFNADTMPELPWRFRPAQRQVTLKVGEQGLAFYVAENLSKRPVTGQAAFNVTPEKAGRYFTKVECFCFTEQTLAAGQQVDMPVSFYVDPAIADDRDLDEVKTITLSYTFFRADDPAPTTIGQAAPAPGGRVN